MKHQYLTIDAIRLKVYGEVELQVKKPGTNGKRRVGRKLHLTGDINMHKIIAAELSVSKMVDGEALPNLFKQACRRINAISDDDAYDIIRVI
ncbi:Mobile element protein [Candidatus Enterovibrio altilux]|uniref:Mobile element protein n=1 Tax=Candidatus Enterovibrio altilux TaxID=1927128 RepID=A0A291B9M5_9GAMM|nr:hypothetical protein [Candidatus Enterovibrio luxaltus]ATF09702.1 Mobile element protein [Candidatus Enterovibrio luxaltus]